MAILRVHDLFPKRALVTRDSGRTIAKAFAEGFGSGDTEATIDFAGIEAVTPSFVDEMLGVLLGEQCLRQSAPVRLVFANVPTRLSAKFAAIGRARAVRIEEEREGTWVISWV